MGVVYTVLVTGSREWDDVPTIRKALRKISLEVGNNEVTLIHGGARGADRLAARAATDLGWKIVPVLAEWRSHSDECPAWHHEEMGQVFCPGAGFRRNIKMVDMEPDEVVAFIRDESSGATQCAKYAAGKGLPVTRYTK